MLWNEEHLKLFCRCDGCGRVLTGEVSVGACVNAHLYCWMCLEKLGRACRTCNSQLIEDASTKAEAGKLYKRSQNFLFSNKTQPERWVLELSKPLQELKALAAAKVAQQAREAVQPGRDEQQDSMYASMAAPREQHWAGESQSLPDAMNQLSVSAQPSASHGWDSSSQPQQAQSPTEGECVHCRAWIPTVNNGRCSYCQKVDLRKVSFDRRTFLASKWECWTCRFRNVLSSEKCVSCGAFKQFG